MLSITAASKKRLAVTFGVGVKRPKKKAKLKRPRGTKFISFTCELDKDNCVKVNGLCIAHKTSDQCRCYQTHIKFFIIYF
jgi:hypothetical protein